MPLLPAFGLYTHIRSNRIRSAILIAGLFLLVWLITFALMLWLSAMGAGHAPPDVIVRSAFWRLAGALPWVSLATAAWVFVSWQFHQGIIDALTGARPVSRAENPRLYNLLENLCISRGIPVPKLEIVDSDVLNAYASGLSAKTHTITLTRGLLDALDDAEVEAVLAHELTHIRNEDVKLMIVAGIVAGAISFFAELFFRSIGRARWQNSSSDRRKGGGAAVAILVAIALIAVAWFLSLVIRASLSRSREYLADAGAVELTKNPDAMISALMKVAGRGELPGVPSGIMEMCLDNPRSGFADLFASHPPIDDRVDALVRYAGGRLPEPAPARPWREPVRDTGDPARDTTDPLLDPWGPAGRASD